MPGPVPKRQEDRIRRNKPEIPIDTVVVEGEVAVPDLNIPNAHSMVVDLYNSLADSGQSRFYEPSDWQVARLLCLILDDFLKRMESSNKAPSSQMLMAIQSLLTDLMTTEGARRRLRMEIERDAAKQQVDDGTAEIIELYERMMKDA